MPDISTLSHKTRLGLAAAGLLLVGGAAGAGAMQATRPLVEMAPIAPVAIARAARSSGLFTLRGRVVEVYGSKFVLQDASGRTLVDLGPRGDNRTLVSPGAIETVQGRYDRGFVHASFLVDASGTVTELGPIGGPPHRGPRGPSFAGGPDGAPPPPPGEMEGASPAFTPPPQPTTQAALPPAPNPATAAPEASSAR